MEKYISYGILPKNTINSRKRINNSLSRASTPTLLVVHITNRI